MCACCVLCVVQAAAVYWRGRELMTWVGACGHDRDACSTPAGSGESDDLKFMNDAANAVVEVGSHAMLNGDPWRRSCM